MLARHLRSRATITSTLGPVFSGRPPSPQPQETIQTDVHPVVRASRPKGGVKGRRKCDPQCSPRLNQEVWRNSRVTQLNNTSGILSEFLPGDLLIGPLSQGQIRRGSSRWGL